jgi:hypothetical protein
MNLPRVDGDVASGGHLDQMVVGSYAVAARKTAAGWDWKGLGFRTLLPAVSDDFTPD